MGPSSKDWLENAYDLNTPEDNRAYYKAFAPSYDAEFAQALGYCYPRIIAEAYHSAAPPSDTLIADIGCGTGLLAEALSPDCLIDGFDISKEMLAQSKEKGLYRDLFECDITQDLSQFRGRYGAVLSAGTFTHGHLGPEPLSNILKIGSQGSLFVIGINKAHFETKGFREKLQEMTDRTEITRPALRETEIYDKKNHEHAQDRALVVTFHKR